MKLILLSEADRWTDTSPGLYGTLPYMAPEFLKQQMSKPIPSPDEVRTLSKRGVAKPFKVPVGPEDRVYFALEQARGRWLTALEILRVIDNVVKKAALLGYGEYPRPRGDEVLKAIQSLEQRGVLEQAPLHHGAADWVPRWRISQTNAG